MDFRWTPEPKSNSELTDGRSRKILTSLSPIPVGIRPVSPKNDSFHKIAVKKDQSESQATADIHSDSAQLRPIQLQKKRMPLDSVETRKKLKEDSSKVSGCASPKPKQWEFKIPKQHTGEPKFDTLTEHEDESKNMRPPHCPPPATKFQRNSVPMPNQLLPSSMFKTAKSKTSAKSGRQKASAQACHFVVAGHQRGAIDEDLNAGAAHTLLTLEAAVARERRLREELRHAHQHVVAGFRSVAKLYLGSVSCSETSLPPVSGRRNVISVPLLKCGVLVQTLVTNVQSQLRYIQSANIVIGMRNGVSTRVCGIDDPGIVEENEDSLDALAIAELKQLYFAYYDCESYVLESANGNGERSKRVGSRHRDIRNVIEEENILAPDGGGADFTHRGANTKTCANSESLLFDEQRERKQIYSDDEEDM